VSTHTHLLIIGAGPFGLALAAYARRHGIDHRVVGEPMGFWKRHMPRGMFLRSACDWHYDPFDEDTIERYVESRGLRPADVEPLALDFYLGYPEWFQRRKGIEILDARVQRLDHVDEGPSRFRATLEDGRTLSATNVALAVGFAHFTNVPETYRSLFPSGRVAHSCHLVDFSGIRGRRVLILGGRQSAFEFAALMREQGADEVHLAYRHPTPAFVPSDWSWVNPIVDAMADDPGWYRRLIAPEKEELGRRQWAEGRMKLEPWLATRIAHDSVHLHPESLVTGCAVRPAGDLEVTLSNGKEVHVDQVMLATGYVVDVGRIPMLAEGNILPRLETRNGFPALDERMQSNLPGLHFTSMCATQDFSAFFGFTVAVRTSARLIGEAVRS
jgi:cation diffusion facilitator CzcD-associated flavoprotein CzcO